VGYFVFVPDHLSALTIVVFRDSFINNQYLLFSAP